MNEVKFLVLPSFNHFPCRYCSAFKTVTSYLQQQCIIQWEIDDIVTAIYQRQTLLTRKEDPIKNGCNNIDYKMALVTREAIACTWCHRYVYIEGNFNDTYIVSFVRMSI